MKDLSVYQGDRSHGDAMREHLAIEYLLSSDSTEML